MSISACMLYSSGDEENILREYSIAASLLLCLIIIQNGGTTEKERQKIPMPCTFNMLCGSSEKRQQNLHTKEWGGGTRQLWKQFFSQPGHSGTEKLQGTDMMITKSSPGSCVSCPAQFAAELGRIGGSSDPCSLQFRGSQPCYRIDSSNLARWTLSQHSYPASHNKKSSICYSRFCGKMFQFGAPITVIEGEIA